MTQPKFGNRRVSSSSAATLLGWLGLTAMVSSNNFWTCHGQSPSPPTTLQSQSQSRSQRVLREATTTATTTTTTPWLQEHFPHDPASSACRNSQSHRICDPDHIMSPAALERIDAYLKEPKYLSHQHDLCNPSSSFSSSSSSTTTTSSETTTKDAENIVQGLLEIQMGVALVQQMDLTPFPHHLQDREERAAETFARYVHDTWGVGVETESCGGAGILVFLSIRDRAIFISVGTALQSSHLQLLTDRRVDHVIDTMKDLLRAQQYDEAILGALKDLWQYLEAGPPTVTENLLHLFTTLLFPLLWMGALLSSIVSKLWTDARRQRDYARVASQLSVIDRAHAEALQGKYRATSCPICLEEFEPPSQVQMANNNDEPSRGICTIGSDGQPIKLLRCGHCMDETCWAEWVSSGRGTITKCPICQQDIGTESHQQQARRRRRRQVANPNNPAHNHDDALQNNNSDDDDNNNNNNNNNNNILDNHDNDHHEERILRLYRWERNFRLARLAYRYPQYIRPAQVQQWSQPNYDGTLVRDPSFVQSNPAIPRSSTGGGTGGSRMGSGGFGGSSSGGGRGGRW